MNAIAPTDSPDTAQLTDIALGFVDVIRDAGGTTTIDAASATIAATLGVTADDVAEGLLYAEEKELFRIDRMANQISTRWRGEL